MLLWSIAVTPAMPAICNMADVVVTDAAEMPRCPSDFQHVACCAGVWWWWSAPLLLAAALLGPRRNGSQWSLPCHCFAASVVVMRAGRIAVGDVSEEDKRESACAHWAHGDCARHLILHLKL
ncbi:hypothetical protein ACQJBY_009845 [Aegilops geniculata]